MYLKWIFKLGAIARLVKDIPEAYMADIALYSYVATALAQDPEAQRLLGIAQTETGDVIRDARLLLGKPPE